MASFGDTVEIEVRKGTFATGEMFRKFIETPWRLKETNRSQVLSNGKDKGQVYVLTKEEKSVRQFYFRTTDVTGA